MPILIDPASKPCGACSPVVSNAARWGFERNRDFSLIEGFREGNPLELDSMDDLQVEIVRFVEECQPNIVEAKFFDSEGRCHTFVDKSAIFTTDWSLDADSTYPQPGVIRCQVLERWQVPAGLHVVRVATEIESTEGVSEFDVLANQLSVADSPAPSKGH